MVLEQRYRRLGPFHSTDTPRLLNIKIKILVRPLLKKKRRFDYHRDEILR